MKILSYSVDPRLASVASKAAKEWNKTLADIVFLKEASYGDIVIKFGKIDTEKYPSRVAQCNREGTSWITWSIILGDHIKWRTSWLERTFGSGENALTALVHEFGHVFGLPHALNPNYVMHFEMGGYGSLSKAERENYRQYILENPNF